MRTYSNRPDPNALHDADIQRFVNSIPLETQVDYYTDLLKTSVADFAKQVDVSPYRLQARLNGSLDLEESENDRILDFLTDCVRGQMHDVAEAERNNQPIPYTILQYVKDQQKR